MPTTKPLRKQSNSSEALDEADVDLSKAGHENIQKPHQRNEISWKKKSGV